MRGLRRFLHLSTSVEAVPANTTRLVTDESGNRRVLYGVWIGKDCSGEVAKAAHISGDGKNPGLAGSRRSRKRRQRQREDAREYARKQEEIEKGREAGGGDEKNHHVMPGSSGNKPRGAIPADLWSFLSVKIPGLLTKKSIVQKKGR